MTHGHDHHHERAASAVELRARALEALLAERGLVSTDAIDAVVELDIECRYERPDLGEMARLELRERPFALVEVPLGEGLG